MQGSVDIMKALITGVTGQDGGYLAELLLARGYTVIGMVRRTAGELPKRVQQIKQQYPDNFILRYGDLTDSNSIYTLIDNIRPDEVYNLAAQSHVGISFENPIYTANTDGLGVLRLLEVIRQIDRDIRFYQASTSELYGKVESMPQNEQTQFHPRSPYGVSKLMAYWAVRNYREAYNIFACNGILFNHESPYRGCDFVTRKITKAVSDITHGRQQTLKLGNLDSKRDWGFAGDYVEAMWLMLQQRTPDDYVIATGETHTVREFTELAFENAGYDLEWSGDGVYEIGTDRFTGKILVEIDPIFYRPAEVDVLIGDASKARKQLGWTPKVTFEDLVSMMVDSDLR
jgi:GDPmannose 4,6-dehydratase